jgi:hypothetical protein
VEIIFEILFGFFGELILQLVGEILLEIGLHSVAEPFRKKPSPFFAAIAYALFGAVIGGLSLRVANTALSPIIAGLSMAAIGKWRAKRGQDVLRIDKFAYGYLFALGFALVRFGFASPG